MGRGMIKRRDRSQWWGNKLPLMVIEVKTMGIVKFSYLISHEMKEGRV
jgi:hypothetical protein